LAVLQALQVEIQGSLRAELASSAGRTDIQVLWIGSVGGMEAELVKRAGIDYAEIPAGQFHGVGIRRLPGNLLATARGYGAARQIVRRYRPQALFITGGFVAAPMALAARKVPSLLYVPDIEPGLALKSLSRFADRIAVTVDDSRAYFSKGASVTVTGYPVRFDLGVWERTTARTSLSLSPDLPTLLVFGGSKGSRSINTALLAILPDLLAEMQVVHISGSLDWPVVQSYQDGLEEKLVAVGHPARLAERYRAYPYLHAEMGAAFAAADLAVCRAGASTLGELPAFGLPAILVPYPHAWRYQYVNAQYLVRQGAGQLLLDQDLGMQLLPQVRQLMREPERLVQMRRAMRSLARPQAARSIAALLQGLVENERAIESNRPVKPTQVDPKGKFPKG
jgi:UDP-N-acetylglucosamine--N-acetylmuramyl-(pentapeptide) pyrophosphoryl-undecaprenol N-acetylglucosamine transferase